MEQYSEVKNKDSKHRPVDKPCYTYGDQESHQQCKDWRKSQNRSTKSVKFQGHEKYTKLFLEDTMLFGIEEKYF